MLRGVDIDALIRRKKLTEGQSLPESPEDIIQVQRQIIGGGGMPAISDALSKGIIVPHAGRGSKHFFRCGGRGVPVAPHAGGVEPSLLIIDPLADFFGGDEIKKAHVIPFIGMLRRHCSTYGATVLLLGHPSVSGMTSGSGSSGNTAWSNSVRSRLYFEKPRAATANDDPDGRTLTAKKSNYGPAGTEISLCWQSGVFAATDTRRPDRFSRIAAESAAETKFLDLLAQFTAAGRIVSDAKGSNFAPAAFANDPGADKITAVGFRTAMARLFAAGRLKIEEYGPPSKRRRELVAAG